MPYDRAALADSELTNLKADQRKKSDIKTKENDMAYTDFDWKSLYMYKERNIGSLAVHSKIRYLS